MDLYQLLNTHEVIEGSHLMKPDMSLWPGCAPLVETLIHGDGYEKAEYSFDGGSGTHTDSPAHFIAGGKTITDIEAQEWISPAVIIDVRTECSTNPDYELLVSDIEGWEKSYGKIPQGALVVMRTGRSTKFTTPVEYLNQGPDGIMHFPGFSSEASRFLVTDRDIHGIGIDTLSLDPGVSTTFAVHHINLGAGKYQIENMDLSDEKIPASGSVIAAAPIRIHNCPEAPTRVYIFVPRK